MEPSWPFHERSTMFVAQLIWDYVMADSMTLPSDSTHEHSDVIRTIPQHTALLATTSSDLCER